MKKTVLILSTTLLLGSVAFAEYGERGHCDNKRGYDKKSERGYCKTKRGDHHMGKDRVAGIPIMKFVVELDLNDKQIDKVYDIFEEQKREMKKNKMFKKRDNNFKEAFSKDSFNKKKFVDLANQREEKRADLVEKVYNILDKSQKEKLFNLINR